MVHPETIFADTKMAVDRCDRVTADSRSAKEPLSPPIALASHRSVDPTREADSTQFSDETGAEFSSGSDMPAARPASTRAAGTGLVTLVPVNRAGFIFEDSDVRYLSRTELEKLPLEQLRVARHEILAREGLIFKDARLSVYFSKFSWYQPSFWRVRLNAIEQANARLIWSIETSFCHSHSPEIARQN
jgi:hypothetical protein